MNAKIEQLWQALEDAEREQKKLCNQALAANWAQAEFSPVFGRVERVKASNKVAAIREQIQRLKEKIA